MNDNFYLDRTLYEGRPANETGRLSKELRTYDLLDGLSIPYVRLDHDPTATVESCHEIDQLLGIQICKNLFLCNSQETDFYLLMMPGDKRFQTALLSRQLGCSRLSFAKPQYMEQFLDITPGSVSVLGLMNDTDHRVRLLIDEDVIRGQIYFGCHPCINTSSLRLRVSDLLEKLLPHLGRQFTSVSLPKA